MTTDAELDDVVPEPTNAEIWRRVGVETAKALSALGLVLVSLAALGVSLLFAAVFGMRMGDGQAHCGDPYERQAMVNPCSGAGQVLAWVVILTPLLWVPATILLTGFKRKSLVRQWLWLIGGIVVGLGTPMALLEILRW